MSTITDKQVAPNVNSVTLRKEYEANIAGALRETARQALIIGANLTLGCATFNGATEADEMKAWCKKATRGKSWETCRSYMAVAKAHGTISTKKEREKAEAWTFEALQVLASTPDDDRKTLIARGGTNPDPDALRVTRQDIADAKLTDEEKATKKKEKETREREGAAEKTAKLVADIKPRVETLLRKDVGQAMVGAASLAQDFRGQDVAAAIGQIVATKQAAQKKIDEMKKANDRKAVVAS